MSQVTPDKNEVPCVANKDQPLGRADCQSSVETVDCIASAMPLNNPWLKRGIDFNYNYFLVEILMRRQNV